LAFPATSLLEPGEGNRSRDTAEESGRTMTEKDQRAIANAFEDLRALLAKMPRCKSREVYSHVVAILELAISSEECADIREQTWDLYEKFQECLHNPNSEELSAEFKLQLALLRSALESEKDV
jgi:hypothetical protein